MGGLIEPPAYGPILSPHILRGSSPILTTLCSTGKRETQSSVEALATGCKNGRFPSGTQSPSNSFLLITGQKAVLYLLQNWTHAQGTQDHRYWQPIIPRSGCIENANFPFILLQTHTSGISSVLMCHTPCWELLFCAPSPCWLISKTNDLWMQRPIFLHHFTQPRVDAPHLDAISSSTDQYNLLLKDFPEITTPNFVQSPTKHNIEHFITTKGPPTYSHTRHLP